MAFNQSQLHVSRPLTDLVVSYDPLADGYARSFFFPKKPTEKLTNQIRQISKGDLLRIYDAPATSTGQVNEVQLRFGTTLSYSCVAYALQAPISALDAMNADSELELEQRTAMQLNASLQQRLEYQAIKNTLRSTAVVTNNTTLSSGQRWDNYTSTSSQPIDDLLAAQALIQSKTGKKTNRLCMSHWTWMRFKEHPNVLARSPVHTTPAGGAIMTKKILAEILDMQESEIMIYSKNWTDSVQGETDTYKNFFGSDIVLAYSEAPSLYNYGFGYEFAFSGLTSDPITVEKYPRPDLGAMGSDVIKMVSIVDFKVLNVDSVYLIKTALNTSDSTYGSNVD